MAGAIAGAYKGASGLPERWVKKVEDAGGSTQRTSSDYSGAMVILTDQFMLAERLFSVIENRVKDTRQRLKELEDMV